MNGANWQHVHRLCTAAISQFVATTSRTTPTFINTYTFSHRAAFGRHCNATWKLEAACGKMWDQSFMCYADIWTLFLSAWAVLCTVLVQPILNAFGCNLFGSRPKRGLCTVETKLFSTMAARSKTTQGNLPRSTADWPIDHSLLILWLGQHGSSSWEVRGNNMSVMRTPDFRTFSKGFLKRIGTRKSLSSPTFSLF